MEEDISTRLLQRLNILISLQMRILFEKSTDQEKIDYLNAFGLKPGEIAEILGSTSNKISKQLYKIKKKGGGKNV